MSASSFRRDAFGGLTDKQYNNRKYNNIMKLKNLSAFAMMALLATPLLTACTEVEYTGLGILVDGEDQFG